MIVSDVYSTFQINHSLATWIIAASAAATSATSASVNLSDRSCYTIQRRA